MDTNYILGILVSFLGLFAGLFLAKNSPEEMKPGEKYFIVFEKIIFIVILLISIVYFLNINNLILFIISLLYVLVSFFNKKYFYFTNYLYYGIIIPFFNQDMRLLMLSLVFIYGLPAGTLQTKDKKIIKGIWFLIKNHALYIIIALIL